MINCPNCQFSYKYKEVPFYLRRVKPLVQEHQCPNCFIWLRPTKKYRNVSLLCITMMLQSILILFIFDGEKYPLIYLAPMLTLIVSAVLLASGKISFEIIDNVD